MLIGLRHLAGRSWHVLLIRAAGIGLALFLSVSPSSARTVVLRADVTVTNDGGVALAPYRFSLAMPAEIHAQQRLLRIETDTGYRVERHANGVDTFLSFSWTVPARGRLQRQVSFVLDVRPYDYRAARLPAGPEPAGGFLKPGRYVESDADEVVRLARDIALRHGTPEGRLMAAFRYPQEHLRYRAMANRGALYGLRTGFGDCTEYAALFVALARAMGYPARLTTEFLFSGRNDFDVPNHHAAEVWLAGQWLPVDPNLALEPSLGYGFGHGGETKVVLKRDDSWTWAQATPGLPRAYRDKHVTVAIRWSIRPAPTNGAGTP